jgi:flagellar biosynthesis/type III secretory pathway chaperone
VVPVNKRIKLWLKETSDGDEKMKGNNTMDEALTNLSSILNKEVAHHELLRDLSMEKRQAIINNDIERLKDVLAQIEKWTVVVYSLEQDRTRLITYLEGQLGVSPGKLSLKEIIDLVEEPHRFLLNEDRNRLKSVMEEVNRINRTNVVLLSDSINFLNYTFNLLAGGSDKQGTYTADGSSRKSESGYQLVDQQI